MSQTTPSLPKKHQSSSPSTPTNSASLGTTAALTFVAVATGSFTFAVTTSASSPLSSSTPSSSSSSSSPGGAVASSSSETSSGSSSSLTSSGAATLVGSVLRFFGAGATTDECK